MLIIRLRNFVHYLLFQKHRPTHFLKKGLIFMLLYFILRTYIIIIDCFPLFFGPYIYIYMDTYGHMDTYAYIKWIHMGAQEPGPGP